MVLFYKIWKKYNDFFFELTNKNGLEYSKNDKSSTLPGGIGQTVKGGKGRGTGKGWSHVDVAICR